MAQHNPEEFVYHYRRGTRVPDYYSFRDELYCGTFPQEWALTHFKGTGPKDCKECVRVGFWNGVFLGYCVACAEGPYSGKRTRGFKNIGEESCDGTYPSAFDTYLYCVLLDDVGDKDFMDSANLKSKLDLLERTVYDEIAIAVPWFIDRQRNH